MRILYERADGAKIVFDSQTGDEIMAHIVGADGKEYPSKLLDNLISHGLWEPVEASTEKAAPRRPLEPVDSDLLNAMVVAIDRNITKDDFQQRFKPFNDSESKAWDDLEREISILARNGIAVEIPAEIPEVFDTGLRN